MTTRKPAFSAAMLMLLLSSSLVHANEYAMTAASFPASVETERSSEPARAETAGGDSSSRYMLGVDAASAARVNSASHADVDGDNASVTTTGAANVGNRVGAPSPTAPANRPRNGNRWQSLVPGAIK